MKAKMFMAALALAAGAAGMPVAAQAQGWQARDDGNWRGGADGLEQRIDSLQQRIDRGVRDGTLDPREARRAQRQLDVLRQQARDLDRNLDNLSRSIRWDRRDVGYGARDPFATDYDAARYYRSDPRYVERRLGPDDEVYRGSDGRYYCKHSDGTTGLIVGGAGGALLGNLVDGGRHRTAGTLIGGALGALLGKSVEQNSDLRCK